MIVDIVDKYCTDDNNPIKKPTLEKLLCISAKGRVLCTEEMSVPLYMYDI